MIELRIYQLSQLFKIAKIVSLMHNLFYYIFKMSNICDTRQNDQYIVLNIQDIVFTESLLNKWFQFSLIEEHEHISFYKYPWTPKTIRHTRRVFIADTIYVHYIIFHQLNQFM